MAAPEDWTRDKVAFVADEPSTGAGPLARQFELLTKSLLDAETVSDVLTQVVTATHRIVPGADVVSITLRSPDGTFHTPAQTDAVATELDRLQYETGEGPCVDAVREPGPAHVRSDDVAAEPAWPRFGPAAATRGVHAVLAVALLAQSDPPRYAGALNIYSRSAGVLDPLAHEAALLLATHASLALAGTTGVTRAELTASQLRKAIDSRDVIGQAKGILMHQRGISADAAFDELRRASQELNVKVADLAAVLAARHAELDGPGRRAGAKNGDVP